MTIDPHDRRRIAVSAICDERTVRRIELGQPVRPTAERRIRRAAERLGIQLPEPRPASVEPSR